MILLLLLRIIIATCSLVLNVFHLLIIYLSVMHYENGAIVV